MNPLQELLNADDEPTLADIRAATTSAITALKHDRRIEALSFGEVRELSLRLYHTPDIRNLIRATASISPSRLEEDLVEARAYINQLTFEVVDPAAIATSDNQQIQRALAARGGQMRIADVPYRAHIYNKRFALLPIDFDDNHAGAFAISEPGAVLALVSLHSRLWRRGERWREAKSARTVEVDLTDVLAELLDGETDEAAAHRLHVSLRTYRRRVKDLLNLLGTHSRFEAGAIAQERGYLDLVQTRDVAEPSNLYLEALADVRSERTRQPRVAHAESPSQRAARTSSLGPRS